MRALAAYLERQECVFARLLSAPAAAVRPAPSHPPSPHPAETPMKRRKTPTAAEGAIAIGGGRAQLAAAGGGAVGVGGFVPSYEWQELREDAVGVPPGLEVITRVATDCSSRYPTGGLASAYAMISLLLCAPYDDDHDDDDHHHHHTLPLFFYTTVYIATISVVACPYLLSGGAAARRPAAPRAHPTKLAAACVARLRPRFLAPSGAPHAPYDCGALALKSAVPMAAGRNRPQHSSHATQCARCGATRR